MSDILHCLIFSLHQYRLILPSAAIAEIIPYEKQRLTDHAENGLLGVFHWRTTDVPLMSLEKMKESDSEGSKIIILNRIYPPKKATSYSFFGMIIKDMPKLYRLVSDNIQFVSDLRDSDSRFYMKVTVLGEPAFIPNLGELWRKIDGDLK